MITTTFANSQTAVLLSEGVPELFSEYVDTAQFENGIFICMFVISLGAGGVIKMRIQHTNDPNDTTPDFVGLENLVFGRYAATIEDAWPTAWAKSPEFNPTISGVGVSTLINNGDGTATATTSQNHNINQGQNVVINGANEPEYNGPCVVKEITGANTFTYAIKGDPSTPATGSISVSRNILGTITKEGVIGTKRYVRTKVTASTAATAAVFAIMGSELLPLYAGGTPNHG